MTKRIWLAALAFTVLAACSNDKNGTGPALGGIEGSWSATALTFIQVAPPNMQVDAIAGGAGLTITFNANGTYQTVTTSPGQPDDMSTGSVSLNGNMMTLDELGGSTIVGTYSVVNNVMTVNLTTGIEFDFGSGDEAATVQGTFVKQ
ncbi:MAG: hypothetical protein AB7I33_00840 [Gemmatimonadales bacterium]